MAKRQTVPIVTWKQLRTILNNRIKDTDAIDWVSLGCGFNLDDVTVVRYNTDHVKVYDNNVDSLIQQSEKAREDAAKENEERKTKQPEPEVKLEDIQPAVKKKRGRYSKKRKV